DGIVLQGDLPVVVIGFEGIFRASGVQEFVCELSCQTEARVGGGVFGNTVLKRLNALCAEREVVTPGVASVRQRLQALRHPFRSRAEITSGRGIAASGPVWRRSPGGFRGCVAQEEQEQQGSAQQQECEQSYTCWGFDEKAFHD